MFFRILKLIFLLNFIIGIAVAIIPVSAYLKGTSNSFSLNHISNTIMGGGNISNSNLTSDTNYQGSLNAYKILYSGETDLNSDEALRVITKQAGTPDEALSKLNNLQSKLPSSYLLPKGTDTNITGTIQSLFDIYSVGTKTPQE